MTMGWIGLGTAAVGAYGSYKSGKAQEEAMENAGELPEWLKPYIIGDGSVPEWVTQQPKTNTKWLEYIGKLGQGDTSAPWQPMNENALQFHPEQQFTPEDDGSQYGALPPGMNQPPPPQMQQGGGMSPQMQHYQQRASGEPDAGRRAMFEALARGEQPNYMDLIG